MAPTSDLWGDDVSIPRIGSCLVLDAAAFSQPFSDVDTGNERIFQHSDHLDPADFLPADPFGMNLETTLTAAMAGWIRDREETSTPAGQQIVEDRLMESLSHYWHLLRWEGRLDMADLLPLDPFGMNTDSTISASISGLVEDFRVMYDNSGTANNPNYDVGSNFGSTHRSPSELNWTDAEATLAAVIAGWMEDFSIFYADHPTFSDYILSENSSRGTTTLPGGYFDPYSVLPSEMDTQNSLTAAFLRWVRDFRGTFDDYMLEHNHHVSHISHYWNRGLLSSSELEGSSSNEVCDLEEAYLVDMPSCGAEDENKDSIVHVESMSRLFGSEVVYSNDHDDSLNLAFSLVFDHLGVQDLLAMERVSKFMYAAVHDDPHLWKCIHVYSSLSDKMTDDALLQLTDRAKGNLQCLSLVGCTRITDYGLRCVLEKNPNLSKLYVPECVRLTVDGIINNLKAFKKAGASGIKLLKLGRLFSLTREQFQDLKLLLVTDKIQLHAACKPRFYHTASVLVDHGDDDDHALDIDLCPLCQKYKLVYDCPTDSCKAVGTECCKACDICILRCIQCGKCIKDRKYVETFAFEYLCSDCWKDPSAW